MRTWVIFCVLLFTAEAGGQADRLAEKLSRVVPADFQLLRAGIREGVLEVTLGGDFSLLRDDDRRERLVRDLFWAGKEASELRGIQVYWQTTEGPRLLNELLRDPAEQVLIDRLVRERPPRVRQLPPEDLPLGGSLSGRTIVVSPGHGYLYYDSLADWSTQRGLINLPGCEPCTGIIEDFSNAEIALRYLVPNLLRAGATVWLVRESDFSTFEQIVDDGDSGYAEEGHFRDGTSAGGFQGDYRVLLAADGGRARYEFQPTAAGEYWVSLWTVSGTNRVTDAKATVLHGTGSAELHLDLSRDGSRWRVLGRYYFSPPGPAAVILEPGPSAEPDAYLVADAVRLGGGIDRTSVAGKTADKPRWQMGALYFLPYFGLPAAANTGSDVTIRPAFAEWQGADAYLSLHSNASGGSTSSASGTSSYRFNCYSYPDHSAAPPASECDDPPGSDRLLRSVHGAIIEWMRQHWDPNWRDRGTLVANFGELRPLESIPGALVESAFHDGVEKASADMRMSDNEALQDPRFRRLLGYAIYAGLARFFDAGAMLLPLQAPRGLAATHAPGGGLQIAWDAVEGAPLYRLRWSVGDRSLGRSLTTAETAVVLQELQPGELVAFQVSAINAGGEGPPSELGSARYRGHGTFADILLVAGFDRQDARIGDGRNRRDQAWDYGLGVQAISDRRLYFDFAANEWVEEGKVPLSTYRAVVWILGEESSADETFSAEEQQAVRDYLAGGGALLASGAEIGWDLVERGTAADAEFFALAFGAAYMGDDAGTASVEGVGPFLEAGQLAFDSGTGGIYPVEYPDVLQAAAGEAALLYQGGAVAAVAYARPAGRSILMGFPLETVVEKDKRWRLLDLCLRWLMPAHTPDDFDSDGLPDEWEDRYGTDPLRPSADEDPDGDGLTNLEEFEQGTDPQQTDLPDGGGGRDAEEADAGTDGGREDDYPAGIKIVGGCSCATTPPGAFGLIFLLAIPGGRRRWHRAEPHR